MKAGHILNPSPSGKLWSLGVEARTGSAADVKNQTRRLIGVDKDSVLQRFELAATGELLGESQIHVAMTGEPASSAIGWQYLYAFPTEHLSRWFMMLERMVIHLAPETLVMSARAHNGAPVIVHVALEPIIENDTLTGYRGMTILNRN